MDVDLQWAFVPEDMVRVPCALCETEFEPKAVIVRTEPYGYEMCEDCLWCLSKRQERGDIEATWPAWEEYQDALKEHPEPIWPSSEAMSKAEDEGTFEESYDASWLWGNCKDRRSKAERIAPSAGDSTERRI